MEPGPLGRDGSVSVLELDRGPDGKVEERETLCAAMLPSM